MCLSVSYAKRRSQYSLFKLKRRIMRKISREDSNMELASQISLETRFGTLFMGEKQADGTYMHSSFLRVGADFVTVFNKASILLLAISITLRDTQIDDTQTDCFLPFCSPCIGQRVMILTDV